MDAVKERFRPGGAGPSYRSTYGYNNITNAFIPENVWPDNIDGVAENLLSYGYRMVCTDGWVDDTQHVMAHGYIRRDNDSWTHDWVGPQGSRRHDQLERRPAAPRVSPHQAGAASGRPLRDGGRGVVGHGPFRQRLHRYEGLGYLTGALTHADEDHGSVKVGFVALGHH